jgi:hypothetical protein
MARKAPVPGLPRPELYGIGDNSGAGVYLKSGLVTTAAHLTALDANMSARIAGVVLPAKVLKEGSLEDVDLSLLLVDHEKFPKSIKLPRMQLCEAPPWPGDPVIVVDAGRASRSHIGATLADDEL